MREGIQEGVPVVVVVEDSQQGRVGRETGVGISEQLGQKWFQYHQRITLDIGGEFVEPSPHLSVACQSTKGREVDLKVGTSQRKGLKEQKDGPEITWWAVVLGNIVPESGAGLVGSMVGMFALSKAANEGCLVDQHARLIG